MISLCNVAYKVVTQVMSNCLRKILPPLIGSEQASFLLSRGVQDNIIIVQKALHTMKASKARHGYMALKIDLEKTDDMLRWDFIKNTLYDMHLPSTLINLIIRIFL